MTSIPFTLFGQSNRITPGDTDAAPRITPRTDLQWGRPLFQAPSLPTPNQRLEELRLNSEFRAKDRFSR